MAPGEPGGGLPAHAPNRRVGRSCPMNASPVLRGLDRWLIPYALQAARRRRPRGAVHLLLCIADHFEPKLGGAPPERARERVDRWVEDYPRLLGDFRDADGR